MDDLAVLQVGGLLARFRDDKTIVLQPEGELEFCLLQRFGGATVKVNPPTFGGTLELVIEISKEVEA